MIALRPSIGLAAAVAVAGALAGGPARADVAAAAPDGFVVQSVFEVEASAPQLYQALVGSVGSWWHPDHTFSGDPSRMSIEPKANGCFCERLDAGSARHMTVIYVDAGRLVRMVGGLGPLQDEAVAGSMSWSFEPIDEGARVIVTYKVSGNSGLGLDQWAPAVDQVLAQAAGRLIAFVTTGSPEPQGDPE